MDLIIAASAVQDAPPEAREASCIELCWQAHVADKYVKRLQKLHPKWGDGSLRAAAITKAQERNLSLITPDFLAALATVSSVLLAKYRIRANGQASERVSTLSHCAK